jgi:hypothetical protein
LVDEDVSAVRSKGDLDSVGQLVAALQHFVPGLITEEKFLGGEGV